MTPPPSRHASTIARPSSATIWTDGEQPGRAVRLLRLLTPGLAILALLAAMWAGLYRLGWAVPPLLPGLPAAHGPLMIGGFLGALISLERAVAVCRPWAYLAPLFSGAGGLMAGVGLLSPLPMLLVTAGSLLLLAVLLELWRTVPALFTATIALGSLLWFGGNLLWLLGAPLSQVVYWWLAFLVLTIAGERLELSRMLRLSRRAQALFVGILGLTLAALLLSLLNHDAGVRLLGAGMLLLALWLGRYDMARRRVGAGGQARYMAVALLSGYAWLAITGVLALLYGGVTAGPRYDAILHALFLGFIMAMIFAHALVILPALSGRSVAYTPALYLPLILLHVTLAVRLLGDLIPYWPARLWGGLLNVLVILLFAGLLRLRLQPAPDASPSTARPDAPSR